MSPVDNNLSLDAKRLANPSTFTSPRPRSSVGPLSDPTLPAPRRTMHGVAFVPRPFPPPPLAGVPIEYIIAQLRNLAPHYWRKPETSDCTIGACLQASYLRAGAMSHLIVLQSFPWILKHKQQPPPLSEMLPRIHARPPVTCLAF